LSLDFIRIEMSMEKELQPLTSDQKSLVDRAHEEIQNRILSGHFKQGEWLRQEELSQQLAVSHTPVRQALDRLVSDGLAERILNRGVRVATIDENEIAETYCLRLLLEPIVARLTAMKISNDQLEHLEAIVHEAEGLTSLDEMPSRRQLNREFHIKISKASESGALKRHLEIIWNRFPDWMLYEGLHRQLTKLENRFQREIEEHQALLEAFAERNISLAEQISQKHIEGTKQDLIDIFEVSSKTIEGKKRLMGLR